MAQRPKKLLDQGRDAIRLTHDSIRTEESYVTWMRRDMLFQKTRHPNEMAGAAIEALLTHVAVAQQVAASTQHQALSALLCLSRDGLTSSLDLHLAAMRAKRPTRVPTVLTMEETLKAIERLSGTQRLMAKRLYGGG
jgi:hypothetical protein